MANQLQQCLRDGVRQMRRKIVPDKPNRNAFIERFNRPYGAEVLDTWRSRNTNEVRELSGIWMLEYSGERNHDGRGRPRS